MSISVVITTYNRASLLEATLEHLARQRYVPGDEVIVVDNGSTDTTVEVVARAGGSFAVPLRQIRELTPGKTPALNAGLAVARGDILALTDDDVLVADDWISTIRSLFADSSLALVGGRVDPRWECEAPKWLRVEKNDRYGQLSSPLALLHYGQAQELGGRTAVGANLVVRRAVHDTLGGFASHLGRRRGTLLCGEDHEFSQRAVAAGYRCEYRPELRVRHWVPAERTRLSYHLRWFFWSGVTNAVLEGTADPVMAEMAADPIPRYLWRQLFTAPLAAAKHALAGRMTDGVVRLMDGAFALGYIAQRVEDRWSRGSRLHSELPAASEPAPIGSSADPRKML